MARAHCPLRCDGPFAVYSRRHGAILASLGVSERLLRVIVPHHALSCEERPCAAQASYAGRANGGERAGAKDYHVHRVVRIHRYAGRAGARLSLQMVACAAGWGGRRRHPDGAVLLYYVSCVEDEPLHILDDRDFGTAESHLHRAVRGCAPPHVCGRVAAVYRRAACPWLLLGAVSV